MAARWGAGEETLTACNMEFFPMDSLDEAAVLRSGETLEALQSCLDPSILSIFEDTPTIETKGLDEESEATLLTALTDILDNVDDENLSPFDTLPDSDLLSGQKGREHSPLRRLLCLSRSPPEKDSLCNTRPASAGKSLPRIQADCLQRSDGEEEDDGSLTLSPVRQESSLESNLLDWECPTLPLSVTFEQEGEDGVSVSLGDLVRHMHPYCMAICVENDDGEQMLPEGGILLEVVDQGENGEPILAIPSMALPAPPALEGPSSENEQKLAEEAASDSSEHIVVDDDVMVSEAPVKGTGPVTQDQHSDVKEETIKQQNEDIKEKSSSGRKIKKKCKEKCQPKPVEGRVLRSGTVRKMAQEEPIQPGKRSIKDKKKYKVPKAPVALSPASSVKPKKLDPCQTETKTGNTTTTLLPKMNEVATHASPTQDTLLSKDGLEMSESVISPTSVTSEQPNTPETPSSAPKKMENSSAAPPAVIAPMSSEIPAAAPSPTRPQMIPPVCEALPTATIAVPELKPKSLSLEEYRRLRQQKKPVQVEKRDNNSIKWPSLPELPKELPPIPCLPDPSPKDSRRPIPQVAKNEVEEVKPAWRPRGPTAPPTPEALLVPPAYMVTSSSKVSAATAVPKPQQTPGPSKPSPTNKPSAPAAHPVKDLPTHQCTTAQSAIPSVPQSSGFPASLKHAAEFILSADRKCSLLSGENRVLKKPQSQLVELIKTCLKTTTQLIKPTAATLSATRAHQKTTVVSQMVPQATAAAMFNSPITTDNKSSKPKANGTQQCSYSAAQPPVSQGLKAEPGALDTKDKTTTAVKPHVAKSPTQELIQTFTSEIGIEAADLTSLLEQFEETQAKEEQCVPEVSGRAAAVGNSSFELAPEKTAVDRLRANDLSSTAALTPPATPPHQMWKPLAPVALLGKSKATGTSKSTPSKVIKIEARPLPSVKSRSKPTPATAAVDPNVACIDHDYCLPNKGTHTAEPGKRWNVKQQSFITIKPIKQPATGITQKPSAVLVSMNQTTTNPALTKKTRGFPHTVPLDHRTDSMETGSVLETPDASPERQETNSTVKERSHSRGPLRRPYHHLTASHTSSSGTSPKERNGGRSRKRRSHRSPSPLSSSSESDSSRSRSRSRPPSNKRYRRRHSESSSSSSSRSSSRSSPSASRSPPRRRRYSYSSSRSGSWSRSRSRSQSPQRQAQWRRSRGLYSPSYQSGSGTKANVQEVKRRKEKAIEERRVVYVGRIRATMTQKELKERFSLFGEIEDCTLHFRDHGDNYGFVTYYDTKDAFTAIENGSKLRKPDELPFDLCFGGRRQFCQTSYSDLDSNREYDPLPVKGNFHALDFDTLLKQAQQNMKR
ncbi:peroxisome proliferator-activated receptor gamma coactivator-related protein 1 [Echeneis naucrates]|uniref:peroxisome proliferator-activated receptor gamma coactivator-related protein 1 n=1 Tax=Echeneis naucrates TaxID=173247 RepID=UPI00111452D4|nr:peroxisome proliferator-activated receptor gamma coactivator-related protein 1 [Echeneis naucrates]